MSGVPYSFDGQHRRLPRQNLRGKVVKEPNKVALIEQAHNCRTRREKSRMMEMSVKIIQAVVRGFLARSRLRKAHKTKYWEVFVRGGGGCDTLESHGEQISRLIKFFDIKDVRCGMAYSRHVDQLIQYKYELMLKCCSDPLWGIRMRNFIRIGISWYLHNVDVKTRSTHAQRSGLLFFETIFDECRNLPDWGTALPFFVKVWLDLSTTINFFPAWYQQYKNLTEFDQLARTPDSNNVFAQKTDDVLSTLKIYFDFMSRLDRGPTEYVIDKNLFGATISKQHPDYDCGKVPMDAIRLYLFGLFTDEFIVESSIEDTSGRRGTGEMLFLLINRKDFAKENFPWKDWLLTLTPERYRNESKGSTGTRHLLSAAISALAARLNPVYDASTLEVISSILCQLISAVDNRFAYPTSQLTERDEILLEDEEDEACTLEQLELKRFVHDRTCITRKLSDYLRTLSISSWIIEGKIKEEAVDALIGCLICNGSSNMKELIRNFPFLGELAYNRTYMGNLYKQVCDEQIKDENRFLNFIWLFHMLMKTFHDVEFMDALQLDIHQLGKLVTDLVDKYTENILTAIRASDAVRRFKAAANKIYGMFLMALHERNTRLHIFPEEIFQSQTIFALCPVRNHNVSMFDFSHVDLKDLISTLPEQTMVQVLKEYPFALPFADRIVAWRRMIDLDKIDRFLPHGRRPVILIRRNMLYEDTFEKVLQVREIRDAITISLVNKVGMLEAGVDGGGLLREFLIEATKAGVDPNRGLFRPDSQNRIYPNPIARKIVPDHSHHYYLLGRLVGKSLYEGTFLELPFSGFFLQKCISGEVDRPVDYLATLDAALHSNLLSLKTYSGDFASLELDFTLTLNELGETKTVELKRDGGSVAVDLNNVIEYIHLVANYKINKEVQQECMCFRSGLTSVVPVLEIFSWREMQTLISGSDKPIDIEDWKQHTNYTAGYQSDHPSIVLFWQVLECFGERHLRKLLKFVTSCSRPPLQGFKDLTPNFGIQSAGTGDRLPTAATCMNLLKLPEYDNVDTLREKLIYAIEAEAGFELS